jgi:hypothetical protein
MCQAEPGLSAERGVAYTSTDRYFSCSKDDVVSEVDTAIGKFSVTYENYTKGFLNTVLFCNFNLVT